MVSRDAASPTETDRDAFVSTLTRLKQRGAALLVVGNLPAEEYSHACTRMSGDDGATRRRLFVTTASDLPAVSERVASKSETMAPEMTTLIRWHRPARSTAPTAPSVNSHRPAVDVQSERLADLGVTISEKIATFDTLADGLEPAELRLCFDSVESVLSTYDREAVFRFLHILVGRIRSVHGMGHFHLPLPRESEPVQVFAQLFDATVELRLANDQLHQRWHLRDSDITSPWLPLTGSQ